MNPSQNSDLSSVMGRSRGLCWRSRSALGAYVGRLGPLSGPMLAVLGRSWAYVDDLGRSRGPCWRSWAALGAYVGGLGSGSGPKSAVLDCSRGLSWRSWPLLGPMLAILGRDQAEKRPKPRKVAQNPSGSRIRKRSRSAFGVYVGHLGPL